MSELIKEWKWYSTKIDESTDTTSDMEEFVNTMAFSKADEIKELLATIDVTADDWMPPYLHVLAQRLLCLMEPNNPETLRTAADTYLRYFGTPWSDIVAEVRARADELEQQNGAIYPAK